MNPKDFWSLMKEASLAWFNDKAPRLGAALAFYTVLSLAPLLIVVIGIAGMAFGEEAARGHLVNQIEDLVGRQGAEVIQAIVENAGQPGSSLMATIIGVAVLLFGAAGVFGQLQDALNTIWEVTPKAGRGILGIIQDRLLSFTMVLAIGFLLLVSLVVSATLSALGQWMTNLVPAFVQFSQVVNIILSLIVITLLFAIIYKVLPDAKIAWRDVWIGAAITSGLFTLGKFLIGLYLGHSSVGSAYGAAGSLVVLLIWVYYSAQIFLFGAELTQAYANKVGSGIVPTPHAKRVTQRTRDLQGIPHRKADHNGSDSGTEIATTHGKWAAKG